MNHHKAFPQLFLGLDIVGIGNNAVIDWADFLAGWCVVMAYTFRAKCWIDDIDVIAH